MLETMDDIEEAKEDALINAGFRNRTNYEIADVYKIFSILYGLVIFVGGVAFSIAHAIVPTEAADIIKYSAEIYFTYLYWVSIMWIMFCIIDILRHQRKVKRPTSTLNRLVSNHIGAINDARLAQSKHTSTFSEGNRHVTIAPSTKLQVFEEGEEDQLNTSGIEEPEINPNEQSADNENTLNFHDSPTKSKSLDDVSHRSSIIKSPVDAARDVWDRRSALSPTQQRSLRTYVRHRKDSIVQHFIGYNYDDNSSVGGLYTRVGIGIFCLGTAIHSSLSILSNLENLACTRWTAIIDDFSRLLFSFIQFFFIFKHSNLIIRANESMARLAVIHIVVTNLCVWFRMVVIETKSQIIEIQSHEIAAAQRNNTVSHSNHDSGDTINLLRSLLILPAECANLSAKGIPITTFIHEGYMRLQPLLYPCTIEFSLMCLTLFFLIWENIGKTFTHPKISDKASTKNVFMVNCHASIKGLFGGMIVFSFTMISIIVYAVFRSKIGDTTHKTPSLALNKDQHHPFTIFTNTVTTSYPATKAVTHGALTSISKTVPKIDYTIVFLETVNLCLLTLSLCATMWSLIKIRKLNSRRTTTRFDDVLIIISLIGIYLYSFFSAFAIISNLGSSTSTWVAYMKVAMIILEFVEGTVHALFILIALRKRLRRTNKYNYPARQMITLLIMLDLSLWLEKTTTTTKHEANPFQLAFYHTIPWSIIAAIATPLQIFFRFHASVCLSHVWAHMYQFPPYEPVISHD